MKDKQGRVIVSPLDYAMWVSVEDGIPPSKAGIIEHYLVWHPVAGLRLESAKPSWWNHKKADAHDEYTAFDGPLVSHWLPVPPIPNKEHSSKR